jgi:hypothetical protein
VDGSPANASSSTTPQPPTRGQQAGGGGPIAGAAAGARRLDGAHGERGAARGDARYGELLARLARFLPAVKDVAAAAAADGAAPGDAAAFEAAWELIQVSRNALGAEGPSQLLTR